MRSFWKITFINSPEGIGKLLFLQNYEIKMPEGYTKIAPLSGLFFDLFSLLPMPHIVPASQPENLPPLLHKWKYYQ